MKWQGRPWVIPLFLDQSDRIVIQKSSQIGLTEWALCDLFSQAWRGRSVMYVLPTEDMVWRFTPRRIGRLLADVPLYQGAIRQRDKDSNTKRQITLFGTDCHIAGSKATNNFYEVPADVLIVDELDQCDQDNINLALTRLGSSTDDKGHAVVRYRMVGNPSVSGRGISARYDASTRSEWFVPCGHCGHRQTLDWWTHFIEQIDDEWRLRHDDPNDDDARPVCEKCGKPFNRLAAGEWVAAHADRDVVGYHANKLFGDGRGGPVVREIFNQFVSSLLDPSKLQQFYNQWLGMPFKAEGTGFTRDMIIAAIGDYIMPEECKGTVLGADVGHLIHVVISKPCAGHHRIVYAGSVHDFDDLHTLWHRFGVARGVIDLAPEERLVRDFCRSHPGAYGCRYSLGKDSKDVLIVDHARREVKTKRTPSLDESYAQWAEGRVSVGKNIESIDKGDFIAHMTAATRFWDDKRAEYVWDEGSLSDHYQHADNYRRIASTMYGGGGLTVL